MALKKQTRLIKNHSVYPLSDYLLTFLSSAIFIIFSFPLSLFSIRIWSSNIVRIFSKIIFFSFIPNFWWSFTSFIGNWLNIPFIFSRNSFFILHIFNYIFFT